jgi:hypothetical protein
MIFTSAIDRSSLASVNVQATFLGARDKQTQRRACARPSRLEAVIDQGTSVASIPIPKINDFEEVP